MKKTATVLATLLALSVGSAGFIASAQAAEMKKMDHMMMKKHKKMKHHMMKKMDHMMKK